METLIAENKKEEIITTTSILVDKVMSLLYCGRVFQETIEEAMHAKLRHEAERVREIASELRELAQAYHKFLDLQKEATERKKRIDTLVGLIGLHEWGASPREQHDHRVFDYGEEDFKALRDRLPLWEAMREFLSYVSEARIAEMENFFQRMDFAEGNRQAIESALKRHPKVFKIRKQKREKYISLKNSS